MPPLTLAKHKHFPHKQLLEKKGYAILLRTQTLISLEAPVERRLNNCVRWEHKTTGTQVEKEGYTIVLGAKKDTQ